MRRRDFIKAAVAVIGVASIDQLKANIAIVKDAKPMTIVERRDLEKMMA